MKKHTLGEYVRYRFDSIFAKGTSALIAVLALFSLAIVAASAFILSFFHITQEDGASLSFIDAAWQSLMRAMDSGSVAGDSGWTFRAVMFLVTLGGIFILSALVGILTTALDSKLTELRKGRSKVLESKHTVILGWSGSIYTILEELISANANKTKNSIVILSEQDKSFMEDSLKERLPKQKRTKIICRSGSTLSVDDLELVNLCEAKSTIILSEKGENPDAKVIKTLLAVTKKLPKAVKEVRIVAELKNAKNHEPAQIASQGLAEFVISGTTIARVMAQTCRQSGLSLVYNELLAFEGDEIYFETVDSLSGLPFGEILNRFDEASIIGMVDKENKVRLNPPMNTVYESGMKLVAIAEDDDKVIPNAKNSIELVFEAITKKNPNVSNKPEVTLILGFNANTIQIAKELDYYVSEGSTLIIAGDAPSIKMKEQVNALKLKNQTLTYMHLDMTDRESLDLLPFHKIDHALVMCENMNIESEEADSRTLISLLHLRDIAMKHGYVYSITSEILDVRNRSLASIAEADDFIVSERLVSLLVAQVAENKALNAVFKDLFDSDGAEVYLKKASDFVRLGLSVNYATVLESAREKDAIAIGFKLNRFSHDEEKNWGVVVNPSKTDEMVFLEDDYIIVISND